MRIPSWKVALIAISVILCVYYLFPTARLASLSAAERAAMPPEQLASIQEKALKLGLDLRGGTYILMEVDKSGLAPEEAHDAVDRALEVMRNRLDQFGVLEPSIQKQGQERIMIQLPGLQDIERAKRLLGQTALLEFRLVEEGLRESLAAVDARLAEPASAPADTGAAAVPPQRRSLLALVSFSGARQDEPGMVAEADVPEVERLLATPAARQAIPNDRTVLWESKFEEGPRGRYKRIYLVRKEADVTGSKIGTASVQPDQDSPGFYQVSVRFTRSGSRQFHRLTRKNIGRLLAIVLDDKVSSAPEIRSAIPGIASISGNFSPQEANDLAIVLRAGRLPAPLKIIEERTVGPSLGADSIRTGVRSALLGSAFVVLFMVTYYSVSGLVANLALLLNISLLLASMSMIGATLTLPGIAGIALTIGMSVDANVLIYERIREELRAGRPVRAAIDKGYEKAVVTILDSNVTTIITALVLMYFGTASVRGFGLTLTIGLVVNMFTAIIVTRVVFDLWTSRSRAERMLI